MTREEDEERGQVLWSPVKILTLCLTITLGVNGYTLREMQNRTDQRYRASDNTRDHALVNFRFSRNEERIYALEDKCEKFIEEHMDYNK